MMSRNSGNHNGGRTIVTVAGNAAAAAATAADRPALSSSLNRNRKQQHRNFVSSHSQLPESACDCQGHGNEGFDDSLESCDCSGGYCCQPICAIHEPASASHTVYGQTDESEHPNEDRDGDCFLRPNRLLDHFYGENLHRFAIYENLCPQCGFGVDCGCHNIDDGTVFTGAYDEEDAGENIYENVCETCSFIYNSDKCEVCEERQQVVKKTVSANKHLHKFAELLGSLRQRIRDRTPKVPATARPRPEIVHTIGDVFKTNKTFDLNEIARLKQQTPTDRHLYGRLRNSDEYLARPARNSVGYRGIKASASDSNFFTNIRLSLTRTSASTNSFSGSSPAVHSPIYENLTIGSVSVDESASAVSSDRVNTIRTTKSLVSNTNEQQSTPSLRSIDIHIDSLRNWMTSLRGQTHDYGDDNKYTACSVKCIPSKYASCCWQSKSEVEMHDDREVENGNGAMSRLNEDEVWTRVDEFRANFNENHSKRNAIYFKRLNKSEPEPITIRVKQDTLEDNSIESEKKLAENMCPIPPYRALKPSELVSTDKNGLNGNLACGTSANSLVKVRRAPPPPPISIVSPYKPEVHKILRAPRRMRLAAPMDAFLNEAKHQHYITHMALSTGLHRATTGCDKQRNAFIKALIVHQQYNDCCKHVDFQRDLNDMFIIFHKTHGGAQPLTFQRKQRAVDNNDTKKYLDDFTLNSCRAAMDGGDRKQIDDFEKVTNAVLAGGRILIEDFQRQQSSVELALPKKTTINDFEIRKVPAWAKETNYSSIGGARHTPDHKEDHEIKIRNVDVSLAKEDKMATTGTLANVEEESIYQPIWKFQTVGSARESDVSFVSEYYTASEFCEEIVDVAEWEVAEEFAFATERNSQLINMDDVVSCEDNRSVHSLPFYDPYRTVCILYCPENTKYNKIIYDYNGNNVDGGGWSALSERVGKGAMAPDENTNVYDDKCCSDGLNSNANGRFCGDSVLVWQHLIRSAAFMEDEDDMMLPESYLLESLVEENNQKNLQKQKDNALHGTSPMVSSNESLTETPTCKFSEDRYDKKTEPRILNTSPPPEVKAKREMRFLTKLQYRRFDVSKNTKKEDGVQGLVYKNLDGKLSNDAQNDVKKSSSNMVFGVDLDGVEKDEKFPNIPKFVAECIKIIELEENIQTNGIYRASGKKDSIDKLKKKMNESKLRKGTKYVVLKDEDVHTVTGALKQFFRELKTDLIPIEIVRRLPDDLERAENLEKIKAEMYTIDFLPRESLKYLLKHLIFVDKNSEHNLMNASNLSIVWGACIFTSSVTAADTIETSDLMKKNTLFKILIQRFRDIFPDAD